MGGLCINDTKVTKTKAIKNPRFNPWIILIGETRPLVLIGYRLFDQLSFAFYTMEILYLLIYLIGRLHAHTPFSQKEKYQRIKIKLAHSV